MNKQTSGWILLAGIILSVLISAQVALANLTFSGTTISGNAPIIIDGSSTISIGASTATAISIGNGSANTSFFGNVGIGTSTPGAKLEVDNSNYGQVVIRSTASGGTDEVDFYNAEGSSPLQIFSSDSGGAQMYSYGDGTIFMSGGKVGINFGSRPATTDAALDVRPIGSAPTLNVHNINGTTALYVANAGNVGVGTTTPSSTFTVSGNFQLAASSTVITSSIGGVITGDGCDSATTTIDSSVTSSTAGFVVTAQNDPGPEALQDEAFVSAPGVLTVRVCSAVTITPSSTPYVVKIIK